MKTKRLEILFLYLFFAAFFQHLSDGFFCAPAQAASLSWTDLQLNDSLTLATEIPLAANLILKKGTHVKVDTINPMDEISVQNIDVVLTPCPASLKDKKTEMTLIQELYGAELTPGCRLELFVEYTDLNRVSVFNSNPPTAKKLHDQTL